MKEFKKIIWFMLGLITAISNQEYGWWGLITIPIWFIIDFFLERLWKWKPEQRTIGDFNTKQTRGEDERK